jgi:hypothetical protein
VSRELPVPRHPQRLKRTITREERKGPACPTACWSRLRARGLGGSRAHVTVTFAVRGREAARGVGTSTCRAHTAALALNRRELLRDGPRVSLVLHTATQPPQVRRRMNPHHVRVRR